MQVTIIHAEIRDDILQDTSVGAGSAQCHETKRPTTQTVRLASVPLQAVPLLT